VTVWSTILPFILTCLAIELTPGPNMTYLAMVAATLGRRAGFAAVAGVALGLALVGLAAALGLAALILTEPALYQLLRWAGVGYLLWLAWDAWQNGNAIQTSEATAVPSFNELFRRGLIGNLLNPKAGVFFIAMLPAFVEPNHPIMPQTITLSIVYVLVATLVHAAIVMLAGALRPWLDDPRRSARASRFMALLLIAVAVWFVIGTRR
jgi:threonine/homoserine/homoserine lactone efflux protein